MDLAYTRPMGGSGTLDIDRTGFYLPCDGGLFEAASSTTFFELGKQGLSLSLPRITMQTYHAESPSTLNYLSAETVLVALYLQIAALRQRPPIATREFATPRSADPADMFSNHTKTTKDIIATLVSLPSRCAHLFRQRHKVTAFAWNNVCIALTADLDGLEMAHGREGLEPARRAMKAVVEWSQTARARRAVLHAAQIYDILSSSRLGEWSIARPDLLLFQSVLILSMYLFVSKPEGKDVERPVFELLQDIDWTAVGDEGFLPPPSMAAPPIDPRLDDRHLPGSTCAAQTFIRDGGRVSFSGEVLGHGSATARKIMLNYVHLLDDIGKYRNSSYSQLLRTMSDFVIERNQ